MPEYVPRKRESRAVLINFLRQYPVIIRKFVTRLHDYFCMPLPTACPECGDTDVEVVTVPPSSHAYEGWETAIVCENCDERIFARELDA